MHEVSVVSKRVGLTVGSSSKQGVLAVELGHVESMVEYIEKAGESPPNSSLSLLKAKGGIAVNKLAVGSTVFVKSLFVCM